jgi:hypothetical protein
VSQVWMHMYGHILTTFIRVDYFSHLEDRCVSEIISVAAYLPAKKDYMH